MVDLEPLVEDGRRPLHDIHGDLERRTVRENHMGAEGIDTGCDRPDVQVVDRRHPFHAQHCLFHLGQIDVGRRGLQKHVQRLGHQPPSSTQDEEADDYVEDWVGIPPAGRRHGASGLDNASRAEPVANDFEECTLHVQALFARNISAGRCRSG